jgi:hypothetical protein
MVMIDGRASWPHLLQHDVIKIILVTGCVVRLKIEHEPPVVDGPGESARSIAISG